MLLRQPRAVFRAYGMPLERPYEYHVLMVEYNRTYLHLAVCEVAWEDCGVEGQVVLDGLGEERALEGVGEAGEGMYWGEVRGALRTFGAMAEVMMEGMRRLLQGSPDSEGGKKFVEDDGVGPFYAAAMGAARAAKAQTEDSKTTRDFVDFSDDVLEEPEGRRSPY